MAAFLSTSAGGLRLPGSLHIKGRRRNGCASHSKIIRAPRTERSTAVRKPLALRAASLRHANPDIQTPSALRIVPWTGSSRELKALEQLKLRLAGRGVTAPNDETLKWFLRDRSFDVNEAQDKVLATLRWRRALDWENISWVDVQAESKVGKAAIHDAHDVLGRPVIVMRPSKHIIGQFPISSTQKLCVLTAEQALEKLPEDGDTVLAIFDLRGFGPLNADLVLVRFLVDLFFVYYPRRLGQVLVVDSLWAFEPVWQAVKPWLKKYSALVRFVSSEQLRREYFLPNTIPPTFRR
ncbi:hypothetical protein BSKO_00361 [Bryopsis sp. KO-2023]|nr:hypothetical protein BSKO_00361 [Bryopsis sp. KO-2023]